MTDEMTPAAPRRSSRKLAVFAGLWIFSVSLGMNIMGTMLLQVIFASLTLGFIAHALVTETRTLRPGGMTWRAGLYLACWGFFILLTGLRPLWLNVVAMVFAPAP